MKCTVTQQDRGRNIPYQVSPVTFSIADLQNFDA
jgi:hypothetical protein